MEQFEYPASLQILLQRHPQGLTDMTQDLGKHRIFCNTAGGKVRYLRVTQPGLLLPRCPTAAVPKHRAAARSSLCSKGMQQGREQNHTMEHTMAMGTCRGKFYSPTNRKHEAPHPLSNILALYISLNTAKKHKAVLRVKNHMILLHSMEKETGYAGFWS